MYFCVIEFEVGVNENIFSCNEQQKVYWINYLTLAEELQIPIISCDSVTPNKYLVEQIKDNCNTLTINSVSNKSRFTLTIKRSSFILASRVFVAVMRI